MKEEAMTDALLREFLLGGLNDEERERIESLFLTDSEIKERVLAVEQDLIEDYLEDSLTREDRERFSLLYAQTAEQRRKLRITKSIKDWAATESGLPQTVSAKVSSWARLRNWLRLNPAVVPVGVAIVIAMVVVAVWLNNRTQRSRHLAIEQELAQLNSPASLREVPSDMVRELSPGAVRSSEQSAELKTSDNIRIVELRLSWTKPERYSNYQAKVGRVGDNKSYTIRNLQAEPDRAYAIRLRLSTEILRRGQYQINLSGITGDGSASLSEEYTFVVAN